MPSFITRPGKVAQWGNSAAIRIGTALLEHAHLHVDDVVEVIAGEEEIIIRRQRPSVTMATLLAQFDPEKHRHDIAFDVNPVGNETR
jgi:antitoxin component of MazEF toxin-antitoxin module